MKGNEPTYTFHGRFDTISDFTSKHITRHGDCIFVKGDGFYANICGAFQKIEPPEYIKEILK